jgi:hypothetical protein
MTMLGFGWLAVRQAHEALKNGRLDEAHRLLRQPGAEGHKQSWDLLQRLAKAFADRGARHLRHEDTVAAWKDLLRAEQVGGAEDAAARLRQELTQRGLAEVRSLLDAGEPGRAAEHIVRLRERSVTQRDLDLIEQAVRDWTRAQDLADRGDFAEAVIAVANAVRLLPAPPTPLVKFQKELAGRRESFQARVVELHGMVEEGRWGDVVRLADEVLALAPQFIVARKARERAWRMLDPKTADTPRPVVAVAEPTAEAPAGRFLLWIDGVGGYLVCLDHRVTLGQATADNRVDVPLYADVSRRHATLTRDPEGYVLEASRPVEVNGRTTERALLQSGDRITLGRTCQLQFRQPVPVSASARLDLLSGQRLPLAVDGVLLMADTLVLGPGNHVHVSMPDLKQAVVLYRQKDGLGVRYGGHLTVDGQTCQGRGLLGPTSKVAGDEFSLSIEPAGTLARRASKGD